MELDFDATSREKYNAPVGNRYVELTAARELERADAIKRGLIDDPTKPKALEDAGTFQGICLDKCPLYEREQREYQNNVERWELDPDTGRISRHRAVKAFHRPAAGNEQSLPSDVRPPHILTSTLDYLFTDIVSGQEAFEAVHGFVRDRTRSIRQDFTVQNSRGSEAIACHERIARFHIVSLHYMQLAEGFSAQQEMEQLRKTLQSLAEYYDDNDGTPCVHEAEFRAYHILIRAREADVLRHVQNLPRSITDTPILQHTLALVRSLQRSNEELGRFKSVNFEGSLNLYTKFFSLVRSTQTSFVMGCLCETLFTDVRKGALKALRKAFIAAHKGLSAAEIMQMLCLDTEDDVKSICQSYGLTTRTDEDGTLRADLHKTVDFNDDSTMPPMLASSVIEYKRGTASLAALMNGYNQNYVGSHASLPRLQDISTTFASSGETTTATAKKVILSPDPAQTKLIAKQSATSNEVILAATRSKKIDAILDQMADESARLTVASMLQQSILIALETHHQKQNQLESYLAGLAETLLSNLMVDQIHQVAARVLAEHIERHQTLKRTIRHIRHIAKRIKQRKIEEENNRMREAAHLRSYENAFKSLSPQLSRVRKRKRISDIKIAQNMQNVVGEVRELSERFWQPINLQKYPWAIDSASDRVSTILLLTEPESTTCKWLSTKFGFLDENHTRSVPLQNCPLQITRNALYEARFGDIVMLIYEVPKLHSLKAQSNTQPSLLQHLRSISSSSNIYFPVLLLCFEDVPIEEVEIASGICGLANDLKSPIAAYEFVQILSMHDVGKFEEALERLASKTTRTMTPTAIAREEHAKVSAYQNNLPSKSSGAHVERQSYTRNGFFDSRVMPMTSKKPMVIQPIDLEHKLDHLNDLRKSMREAQELISQTGVLS